jgi:hypothetical protein
MADYDAIVQLWMIPNRQAVLSTAAVPLCAEACLRR